MYTSFFSGNRAYFDFQLSKNKNRPKSKEIVAKLEQILRSELSELMPRIDWGYNPFVSGQYDFEVSLKSSKEYDEIQEVGAKLMDIVRRLPPPYSPKDSAIFSTRIEAEKDYIFITREQSKYLYEEINPQKNLTFTQ